MSRPILSVLIVTGATIGSRISGLLRDIVVFSLLGASVWNSAFVNAFTLPNLFRRLLGEGAMTSALIPVFSSEHQKGGRERAFLLLNRVLSRLGKVLLTLVLAGSLMLSLAARSDFLPERWQWVAGLAVILFPYLLLICLSAIIAATLNALQRFGAAALTQLWLNLSIMAGALLAMALGSDPASAVGWICLGVLVGGLLQLLAPARALRREGWTPAVDWERDKAVSEVRALLLPGLAGAAVIQVNTMVTRFLAFSLPEDAAATSILYLANRLVELPLGVFALSVVTVCFPRLAQQAAQGDHHRFAQTYLQGARVLLAMTLPASVGLIVLGEPILKTLFVWGAFRAEDATRVAIPLALFACALPSYALATLAVRAFHARRDMRTPLRASMINFTLNLVGCLVFMQVWGMPGLALANVLATWVYHGHLRRRLRATIPEIRAHRSPGSVRTIALAALGMGLAVFSLRYGLAGLGMGPRMMAFLQVALGVPLGIGAYALLLHLLRYPDLPQLSALVAGLWRRRAGDSPGSPPPDPKEAP